MITIENIAKHLQELLNTEAKNFPALNTTRKIYRFKIFTHTGEYEKATVDGNTATIYINCVLTQNGATIEGQDLISSIINASLDMLVPIKKGVFGGTPEVVKSVGDLLNNTFSKNSTFAIKNQIVGFNYNLINSGDRDMFSWVGDGFTFSANMEFYIIENGINSNQIKYFMNGYPIYLVTGGMTRGTQQETQVSSQNSNKVAQSITTASVLTFTFVMPMRNDYVSNAIRDFINTGKIETYTISKSMPQGNNGNSGAVFNMVFSEVVESYDNVKNVGIQVTMVEAL